MDNKLQEIRDRLARIREGLGVDETDLEQWLNENSSDRKRNRKWREEHREQLKARNARWYEEHREQQLEHMARYKRKRNYNLSHEEYLNLYENQESRCAICQDVLDMDKPNSVHIDHDHGTGKVRGLLCAHCNLGLGHFKDRIDLLRSAIKYLDPLVYSPPLEEYDLSDFTMGG